MQDVTEFIELGPGNVLTGLMKRIDKSAAARAVGTAAEVQEWSNR
jgi:malonyl CoA-acyl carrier protein transacylase